MRATAEKKNRRIDMYRFAASAVVAFVCFTVATSQSNRLPCNSQLRLLPQFAHLFAHCGCAFSEWSDWAEISSKRVPRSQCPSGKVVTEERRRTAISGDCDDKRKERTICEPDIVDKLILALGLGSSGHYISPEGTPGPTNVTNPLSKFTCTDCEDPLQVCRHVTTPPGPRRYVRDDDDEDPTTNPYYPAATNTSAEPPPLPYDPTPFSIADYGARYRRRNRCKPDGIQHIVFVLDTSSSIGQAEFDRLTAALSALPPLFCRPIKIAVLTFDHEYFAEFCFDCFDNTCSGRLDAGSAIRKIRYHRPGARFTHTAGAAKCVCDLILSRTCGLDIRSSCIDVVFITDGRSNDPYRNVCTEVRCLHNRFGVNTFAIGIGDINQSELDCIGEGDISHGQYAFNFYSFYQFENVLQEIIEVLSRSYYDSSGDRYVCPNPRPSHGAEGCTFFKRSYDYY